MEQRKSEKTSKRSKDTRKIASEFSRELSARDLVCLYGSLGAGKTVFVKGLVEGLGGNADEVKSPTFTILQTYSCDSDEIKKVYHLDLYRLEGDSIFDVDLEGLLGDDEAVVVIEWAGRINQSQFEHIGELLKGKRFDVKISFTKSDNRKILVASKS